MLEADRRMLRSDEAKLKKKYDVRAVFLSKTSKRKLIVALIGETLCFVNDQVFYGFTVITSPVLINFNYVLEWELYRR